MGEQCFTILVGFRHEITLDDQRALTEGVFSAEVLFRVAGDAHVPKRLIDLASFYCGDGVDLVVGQS